MSLMLPGPADNKKPTFIMRTRLLKRLALDVFTTVPLEVLHVGIIEGLYLT